MKLGRTQTVKHKRRTSGALFSTQQTGERLASVVASWGIVMLALLRGRAERAGRGVQLAR